MAYDLMSFTTLMKWDDLSNSRDIWEIGELNSLRVAHEISAL